MSRLCATFIVLSLLAANSPCSALDENDHLRPDAAYISNPSTYQFKLSEIFAKSYQDDSVLQMLMTSSSMMERVVSIQRTGGVDQVMVMEPKHPISAYQQMEHFEAIKRGETSGFAMPESHYQMMRKELPGTYKDVPIKISTQPIPAALTDRVANIWKAAILGTRYGQESGLYIDGGWFTFSMRLPRYGAVSGTVYSPEEDTAMYKLVELATALGEYANGRGTLGEIGVTVAECEKRLGVGG